jgi:hypothetical protein
LLDNTTIRIVDRIYGGMWAHIVQHFMEKRCKKCGERFASSAVQKAKEVDAAVVVVVDCTYCGQHFADALINYGVGVL